MRLFTITCVLFFMLHMIFPSYSVAISFKPDGDIPDFSVVKFVKKGGRNNDDDDDRRNDDDDDGGGWGNNDDWNNDDGPSNDIPLDGGLSFLAAAGAAFGIKKLSDRRSAKNK